MAAGRALSLERWIRLVEFVLPRHVQAKSRAGSAVSRPRAWGHRSLSLDGRLEWRNPSATSAAHTPRQVQEAQQSTASRVWPQEHFQCHTSMRIAIRKRPTFSLSTRHAPSPTPFLTPRLPSTPSRPVHMVPGVSGDDRLSSLYDCYVRGVNCREGGNVLIQQDGDYQCATDKGGVDCLAVRSHAVTRAARASPRARAHWWAL